MSGGDAFRLAAAILLFFVSGWTVVSLIERGARSGPGLGTRLALSFMAGLGGVSLEMFFLSLLGIGFGLLSISLPWIVAALCVFFVNRRSPAVAERRGSVTAWQEVSGLPRALGVTGTLSLAVILFELFYAFRVAPVLPITGWDSIQTWFFKAVAFYEDGRVSSSFLLDTPLVHPDYPLLIPLSVTWLYIALGRVSDELVRIIYPLQFLSLLLVFYHVVRSRVSVSYAMLFTALLSLTPILMVHSAGLIVNLGVLSTGDSVGYADLAFAVCTTAGAGFLYLYAVGERPADLNMAMLFAGISVWTKDEGLVLITVCVLLAAAHALHRRVPLRNCLVAAGVVLVTAGPWLVYKGSINIPGEYASGYSPQTFIDNIGRLSVILDFFGYMMFKNTSIYSLTWYLYALSLALNYRGFFSRPLLYLNIVLAALFSSYVLVYIISFLNVNFHLATSIDRVILHMLPLAMLIAALNLATFLGLDGQVRSAPGGAERT